MAQWMAMETEMVTEIHAVSLCDTATWPLHPNLNLFSMIGNQQAKRRKGRNGKGKLSVNADATV